MANSTASTLLTYAWNLLKEDGSSVSHPALQQTQMLSILSSANNEWMRTFKRTGEPPKVHESRTGYTLFSNTTLSANLATTDVTASLTSSTSFPASGAVVVYDDGTPDMVEYTSNAANTLSGVTGVDFAHETGDEVAPLYALPSNFHSFRRSDEYGDGVKVGNIPFFYSSSNPTDNEFSIYDNGTTKYLWLPLGLTGDCSVSYNKISTVIDGLTDVVDVPTDYEYFLVHRLVEHGRRARGDNADKVMEARQLGNDILLQAQKEKNIGKFIKTRRIGSTGSYEPAVNYRRT